MAFRGSRKPIDTSVSPSLHSVPFPFSQRMVADRFHCVPFLRQAVGGSGAAALRASRRHREYPLRAGLWPGRRTASFPGAAVPDAGRLGLPAGDRAGPPTLCVPK